MPFALGVADLSKRVEGFCALLGELAFESFYETYK